MLKSMTAYGRSLVENELGQCSIEISCVNRRHLEVHLVMPKELLRFEHLIRKKLSDKLSRGYVTVKASFRFNEKTPFAIKPNLPFCKQQYEGWVSIAKMLGKPESDLPLSLIQNDAAFVLEEDEEALLMTEKLIMSALSQALRLMQEMMEKEGYALTEDVSSRCRGLSVIIQEIEKIAPQVILRMREKLTQRLKEMFPVLSDNEDKILREVCLLADKVDIAEEITRLNSHFLQFNETVLDQKQPQGKKLEFILQEIQREINTIASKSQDTDISRFVIEFKGELERIREQLQNVE